MRCGLINNIELTKSFSDYEIGMRKSRSIKILTSTYIKIIQTPDILGHPSSHMTHDAFQMRCIMAIEY